MNDIATLLGTKNKREQAERIANLQQALQVQPVDLIVRFDPRVSGVVDMAAIGGQLNAEQIRIVLNAALETLRQVELKAAKELSTDERQDGVRMEERKEQDEG